MTTRSRRAERWHDARVSRLTPHPPRSSFVPLSRAAAARSLAVQVVVVVPLAAHRRKRVEIAPTDLSLYLREPSVQARRLGDLARDGLHDRRTLGDLAVRREGDERAAARRCAAPLSGVERGGNHFFSSGGIISHPDGAPSPPRGGALFPSPMIWWIFVFTVYMSTPDGARGQYDVRGSSGRVVAPRRRA